jgi:hypothetical protein
MNAKLENALLDLLVALGLCERPKLQPIPVRNTAPNPKSNPPRHTRLTRLSACSQLWSAIVWL